MDQIKKGFLHFFGTGPEQFGLTLSQKIEEQKRQIEQMNFNSMLSEGIIGLQNYSYYCYLNSCLQCLLVIEQLRNHYLRKDFRQLRDVS